MRFCISKTVFLFTVLYAISCSSLYSQTILKSGSFYQTDFELPNLLPVVLSPYNSKSVDRTEIEIQNLSTGLWLNYRIRFQNDGNAVVANIRINDSLSSFLDFNTFQFTGSSHQGHYVLYTSGNLYIYYNGINLPDSASTFSGSQGSFRFKIKPKENLPVGTTIFNTAEIQFDFKPPIMTNTVQTDIVNYTSISIFSLNNEITVYPNPAINNIILNWFKELEMTQVQVLDLAGRLVLEKAISSPKIENVEFNLTSLSKGVYFIKINHQHGVNLIKFKKQ